MDSYVRPCSLDMVKNLSELVIVVNGELTAKSYAKLTAFTDNIILRENKGLDAWAYKTAMESYGWDRLVESTRSSCSTPPSWDRCAPSRRCSPRWPVGTSTSGNHLVPSGPRRPLRARPGGYLPVIFSPTSTPTGVPGLLPRPSRTTGTTFLRSIPARIPWGSTRRPFTQRFERLGFTSDVYVNTEDLEGYTSAAHPLRPQAAHCGEALPHLQAPLLLPQLRDVLTRPWVTQP